MIIDTHTHFYDPTRPQGVPWPRPDDKVLYRTVLPEHCRQVAEPCGVTGTIVVEASRWRQDNQWVLDLAADDPFIVGLVGNLDPADDGFADHLQHYAQNPLFRGIRLGGAALRDLDGEKTEQLAMLADLDLSLDLLVDVADFPHVSALAVQNPTLRIVVNHIAGVPIRGADAEPDLDWQDGVREAAEHAHVYCKVSGLVEVAGHARAPTDPGYYARTIDVLWEAFGGDRLIYGSNWPVSERYADYGTVFRLVDAYFTAKGGRAREKYFWKNSKGAYKWIDRGAAG